MTGNGPRLLSEKALKSYEDDMIGHIRTLCEVDQWLQGVGPISPPLLNKYFHENTKFRPFGGAFLHSFRYFRVLGGLELGSARSSFSLWKQTSYTGEVQ